MKSIKRIVHETNERAKEVIDDKGNTYGGPKWKDLDVEEFKVFLCHNFVYGHKSSSKHAPLLG